MRMPIDGGSVPSFRPAATSAAARCACSSSSRRGDCRSRPRSRCGNPRPARASACRRRAGRCARRASGSRPSAAPSDAASGACSWSVRSATAAQLLRRVGLEQMRAAVDDVHRLPRGRVAGKPLGDADVGLVEQVEDRDERLVRNRGGHGVRSGFSRFQQVQRKLRTGTPLTRAISAMVCRPSRRRDRRSCDNIERFTPVTIPVPGGPNLAMVDARWRDHCECISPGCSITSCRAAMRVRQIFLDADD